MAGRVDRLISYTESKRKLHTKEKSIWMDVPLQDVLIGCYCKQTEETGASLANHTSSQHPNAMHKKPAKTEYMGGFAKILWKSNHGNGTKLALDIT